MAASFLATEKDCGKALSSSVFSAPTFSSDTKKMKTQSHPRPKLLLLAVEQRSPGEPATCGNEVMNKAVGTLPGHAPPPPHQRVTSLLRPGCEAQEGTLPLLDSKHFFNFD